MNAHPAAIFACPLIPPRFSVLVGRWLLGIRRRYQRAQPTQSMSSQRTAGTKKGGKRHETAGGAMLSQRKEGRRTRTRCGFRLATALPLVLLLLALFQGLPPVARAFILLPPRIGRWQSTVATTPMASQRRYRGSSTTTRGGRLGEESTGSGETTRIRGCRRHPTAVLSMGGSVEEEWPFHKSRSALVWVVVVHSSSGS